ncbi:MAG: PD40 domain-containing protein, partial [Magnetococcales bacterium]|nr:PD40 domain-containing protein [Magnetococcales bacterium]
KTGQTSIVSVDSTGNQGNARSDSPAISANGRYVAFVSSSSNLVAGDTNGVSDIFLRDVQNGQTSTVSVDSSGSQSNGDSTYLSISDDGRFVVFTSTASNLVAGDTNGVSDIFLRDVQNGQTSIISVDSSGNQGNDNSFYCSGVAGGRYIAFASYASNLVAEDTNNRSDVFLRDIQTGQTSLVSVDSLGNQSNGNSYEPAISSDGRYVAFASNASNLVTGDTNGVFDVFLRDTQTKETSIISVDLTGNQGNSSSFSSHFSISADGKYVVFMSDASNLVDGDTNGTYDVFLSDIETGQLSIVSLDSSGNQGNARSTAFGINEDGRYVVFESDASNLTAGDINGSRDVFLRRIFMPGEAGLSSTQLAGLSATQLDGLASLQLVAFSSDQLNGLTSTQFTSLADTQLDGLTADQFMLLADTQLNGLNSVQLIALADTQLNGLSLVQLTGLANTQLDGLSSLQLASLADTQFAGLSSQQIAALADTQLAALSSSQLSLLQSITSSGTVQFNDLTSVQLFALTDTQLNALTSIQLSAFSDTLLDGLSSVQLNSLSNTQLDGLGSLQLGSLADTQLAGIAATQLAGLADTQLDGLTSLRLSNLAATQLGELTSAQLRGLSNTQLDGLTSTQLASLFGAQLTGSGSTMTRVSVASDESQGNGYSISADVSADGRYVVFASMASNLVAGDTNGVSDIFLRDTQTNITTLVSVVADGSQGSGSYGSIGTTISSDGRYVAFYSFASNLVAEDTNGSSDIFLRDNQTNTTSLVSVASDRSQGNGGSYSPIILADGRYVVFDSSAFNLVAEDTNGKTDIFLRDNQTNTTCLVSVASDGSQGDGDSYTSAIAANGRYVVFRSDASNLVVGDTNGAPDIFLRDTQTNITSLVSVAADGSHGNSGSYNPTTSADGRYIAFGSSASNLVAGDTNGSSDIFLRDTLTNSISLISVSSDGSQGNGDSYSSTISADGRYVIFASNASNLVVGDANGTSDIFLRDTLTNTTSLISVAADGSQGNNNSDGPTMSADGKCVLFFSNASNFVPGDSNGQGDVFLVRLNATLSGSGQSLLGGLTSIQLGGLANTQLDGLAMVALAGLTETQWNGLSSLQLAGLADTQLEGISSAAFAGLADTQLDGLSSSQLSHLAGTQLKGLASSGFASLADTQLDGLIADQFMSLADTQLDSLNSAQLTALADSQLDGLTSLQLGGLANTQLDGLTSLQLASLADTQLDGLTSFQVAGLSRTQINGLVSGKIACLANTQFIGLSSLSLSTMSNEQLNGFSSFHSVMEFSAGNYSVEQLNFDIRNDVSMSSSGRYVVFSSDAQNLVSGDSNSCSDIFLFDVYSNTIYLVSTSSDGIQANQDSYGVAVSNNGLVAFRSYANNLVDNDTNNVSDVFLHDVQAGDTIRVSVNSSGEQRNGVNWNADRDPVIISSDGKFVVYGSASSNLVENDSNGIMDDLFMYAIDDKMTSMISVSTSGQQ